jgi:hypothetical protein
LVSGWDGFHVYIAGALFATYVHAYELASLVPSKYEFIPLVKEELAEPPKKITREPAST